MRFNYRKDAVVQMSLKGQISIYCLSPGLANHSALFLFRLFLIALAVDRIFLSLEIRISILWNIALLNDEGKAFSAYITI